MSHKENIRRIKMKGTDDLLRNEERPYDIIIFAASSSVGQFLVEELALIVDKRYSISSIANNEVIKWAVAGRSAVRLNETLCRAELDTGINQLSQHVPILLADLNKDDSLVAMCKKTRLVINCAGPYSKHGGETLIKASLECNTNYVDLSHETTFNEMIRQNYSESAKQRGIFILQGCGFQSMSSELGLNFIKQVADGQIEEVKIILDLSSSKCTPSAGYQGGIVTSGMWQSLLVDKAQELPTIFSAQIDDHPNNESHIYRRKSVNSNWKRDEPADCGLVSNTRPLLQRKDTQSLVKDIIQFRNRHSLSFWWPSIKLIQNSIIKLLKLISPNSTSTMSDNLSGDSMTDSRTGYTWPINCLTSDESQLIRGEMLQYELVGSELDSQAGGWRPIRCSNFISIRSFLELSCFCLWLFVFQTSVKFRFARYLMSTFPRLATLNHVYSPGFNHKSKAIECSHNSGSNQALDRASLSRVKFSQIFVAYGTPNEELQGQPEKPAKRFKRKLDQLLVSRVVGPEPNHVATATFAIQAALTLLLEREHLPRSTSGEIGGVLTPGAAFADTNIIHQLRRRNIKFEVLKKA